MNKITLPTHMYFLETDKNEERARRGSLTLGVNREWLYFDYEEVRLFYEAIQQKSGSCVRGGFDFFTMMNVYLLWDGDNLTLDFSRLEKQLTLKPDGLEKLRDILEYTLSQYDPAYVAELAEKDRIAEVKRKITTEQNRLQAEKMSHDLEWGWLYRWVGIELVLVLIVILAHIVSKL